MIKEKNFFDDNSSLYKYRLNYHELFFKEISVKLGFNGNEYICDLCCGNGQLANGLIQYVGSVLGVDSSSEMLNLVKPHNRISYLQADIDHERISVDNTEPTFDFLFIGHAVHWIKQDSLERIIKRNLNKNGSIVILGNHWDPNMSWVQKLYSFIEPYKSFDISDVGGQIKLSKCGFQLKNKIIYTYESIFNLQDVANFVQSLARYGEKISLNPSLFYKKLSKELLPYCNENLELNARVINWALCYQ